MAANKLVHFGPVALTNTLTTNILNPGTTTGGVGMPATSTNLYFVLRHIRIVNKTAGAVTFTITNKGKSTHDFKIAGKKSAVLRPGKTAKLSVVLKKGKAAYLCTLPGHAAAGMKGTITVK